MVPGQVSHVDGHIGRYGHSSAMLMPHAAAASGNWLQLWSQSLCGSSSLAVAAASSESSSWQMEPQHMGFARSRTVRR